MHVHRPSCWRVNNLVQSLRHNTLCAPRLYVRLEEHDPREPPERFTVEAFGTPRECVSSMDDKLRNEVDEDDETPDRAEESGPLGRLLEQRIGSGGAESEGATQILKKPSQPSMVSTDYAEGTREHDDDREG